MTHPDSRPDVESLAGGPAPGFYSRKTYVPERSVGLLMRRVLQSVAQQVDRRLLPQDLTHAQWVPLFKLRHGHCGTVASLARELQTDPGAMTRTIDRLEIKGLLKRVRSTHDRRVVQLQLTHAGSDLADSVLPLLAEVLDAHLHGFSDAECELLISLLQRMLANGERLREVGQPTPPSTFSASSVNTP